MVKLPLESLLEAGFFALKSELGRRVYGEEIVAGASVDDALRERSIEDYKKSLYEGSPVEKLFAAIGSELSEEQSAVFDDSVPFFKRDSREYNGFILEYHVYPEEKSDNYEKNADDIIENYKISSELIYINKKIEDDKFLLVGMISMEDGKVHAELEDDLNIVFPDETKLKIYTKKKAIEALSGIDYCPMKIYQSLIYFIS